MKKFDLVKITGLAAVSAFSVVALAFQTGSTEETPVVRLSSDTLVRNYSVYDEPITSAAQSPSDSNASTLDGWEYTLRIRPPKCRDF